MVNNFLLEIGCEELPSGAVLPLAEELMGGLSLSLDKAELRFAAIKQFASPRRIAVFIQNLEEEQPPQKLIKRGPSLAAAYDASGNPSKALLGFIRSANITLNQLQTKKTEKGDFLVFETQVPAAKTTTLMPQLIEEVLASLTTFKPMRWGNGDFQFARPVHWILMLYGKEIVPAEFFGLKAAGFTYGHRFHQPEAISLSNPNDYEQALEKASVMADFFKRKQRILTQIHEVAASINAKPLIPENLVNEVTSIVEWSEALMVPFDPAFLKVPEEVLITAMQVHQKCFPLKSLDGHLLPNFITISNISSQNPQQVIAGNAKVMQARLSDAAFFFEQDKKIPLEKWIAATEKVIFQNKLGSLLDKAKRVEMLAIYLANLLGSDAAMAKRAAALSKCDLMTGMVGEFPELQGLMGYYYALNQAEPMEIASALNEQYLPRFSSDLLPESPLGKILSLADRVDTLVGIFGIGLKPSGVKDPFKLRRHALALGRLLIEIHYPLSLSKLILEACNLYPISLGLKPSDLIEELRSFIFERLLAFYSGKGISQDKVLAIRACQEDNLNDFDKRIQALNDFVGRPEAFALAAACKRVGNILQRRAEIEPEIQQDLLIETAELTLYQRLVTMETAMRANYEQANYVVILESLASLRAPIDQFFDEVMVMVEDVALKNNRLALLSKLQCSLQGVADISLLQAAL